MKKNRKAIALLITISFIMLISIIVAASLENSKKFLDESNNITNLAQTNKLISDANKIISNFSDKIEDASMLDMIYTSFPIMYDDFGATISIEPIENKIELNSAFSQAYKDRFETVFENIFAQYDVGNSNLFFDLIYDTIDSDLDNRSGFDTEIILKDPSFQNGQISSQKSFKRILDEFAALTNDNKIFEIPWSEIVYIDSNPSKTFYIYRNGMHSSLLEAMELIEYEDIFLTQDELNQYEEINKIKLYNLLVFKKGEDFRVLVKLEYSIKDDFGSTSFIYNFKSKSIQSIESIN
jgi:hypothetical protein